MFRGVHLKLLYKKKKIYGSQKGVLPLQNIWKANTYLIVGKGGDNKKGGNGGNGGSGGAGIKQILVKKKSSQQQSKSGGRAGAKPGTAESYRQKKESPGFQTFPSLPVTDFLI